MTRIWSAMEEREGDYDGVTPSDSVTYVTGKSLMVVGFNNEKEWWVHSYLCSRSETKQLAAIMTQIYNLSTAKPSFKSSETMLIKRETRQLSLYKTSVAVVPQAHHMVYVFPFCEW